MKFLSAWALILLLPLELSLAGVPPELEADYTEGLAAFQKQDYRKTLAILDDLGRHAPDIPEFLEMRGLVLKRLKKTEQAQEAFENVIKLSLKKGRNENEILPDYFELGLIYTEAKEFEKARNALYKCVEGNYNRATTEFFLGLNEYRAGLLDRAEKHFRYVGRASGHALRPASFIYFAEIAAKRNNMNLAARSLAGARTLASQQLSDVNASAEVRNYASQIKTFAEKALASLNEGGAFAAVTLLSGYDSNVLGIPASALSTASGSPQPSSYKETLIAELGYATSPTKEFQIVPTYRGTYNYDFNRNTQNGEFLINDFSVYFTHTPLERTSYGLRTEGIYTFEHLTDAGTGKTSYTSYDLLGSVAPYFKYQTQLKLAVGGELTLLTHKNFLDPTYSADFKQSGTGEIAKVYVRDEGKDPVWNPELSLSTPFFQTTGIEYRSVGAALDLVNRAYPTDRWVVGGLLGVEIDAYNSRPAPHRLDKILRVGLTSVYKIARDWNVLAQLLYLDNTSNISDYQFTRLNIDAGVTYSF